MIVLNKIGTWVQLKVVDPLIQILRRGTEPDQLALSAAVGFTLGIFPICGVPIFLCGVAIALLGPLCHAPSVMLANFVITPIEISLIVPFLRFGEFITGGQHFALTPDALKKVLTGQASYEVLQSVLHALLGWLIAAPFIMAILYVVLRPCCRLLVRKFGSIPLSPKKSDLPEMEIILKVRDV
uniref:DUF2062 domain-containing protein n=1 Tax=Kalanchoe fedtschenkoi TaxID=63787 RepID=A0A7N0UU22_KALFE